MIFKTRALLWLLLFLGASMFVVLVIAQVFYGINLLGPDLRFEDYINNNLKMNQLVSSMRINLHAAAEAEKSAVLADTDEASHFFAELARQASLALEKNRLELEPLISKGSSPQELELFRDFSHCWLEFQKIDRLLLDLAVQNTNIKASNLSFGLAGDTLKRLEKSINIVIADNASSPEGYQILLFSSQVLTGALKIHALQAPHIAESQNEKMDKIEAEMKIDASNVQTAFDRLTPLVTQSTQPAVETAKAAYGEFSKINEEIIRLSRLNSNVESLAISLGRKRKVSTQCEEILSALNEALRSRTFKATR